MVEFVAPLLALLCLIFLGLLLIARSHLWRLVYLWSLGVCLFLGLAWSVWFGWLYRDGLAPGLVESHGWTALSRFLGDFWPVLIFALVISVATYFANRWSLMKIKARNA